MTAATNPHATPAAVASSAACRAGEGVRGAERYLRQCPEHCGGRDCARGRHQPDGDRCVVRPTLRVGDAEERRKADRHGDSGEPVSFLDTSR